MVTMRLVDDTTGLELGNDQITLGACLLVDNVHCVHGKKNQSE